MSTLNLPQPQCYHKSSCADSQRSDIQHICSQRLKNGKVWKIDISENIILLRHTNCRSQMRLSVSFYIPSCADMVCSKTEV